MGELLLQRYCTGGSVAGNDTHLHASVIICIVTRKFLTPIGEVQQSSRTWAEIRRNMQDIHNEGNELLLYYVPKRARWWTGGGSKEEEGQQH